MVDQDSLMEQQDLFQDDTPLSKESELAVMQTLQALVDWGVKEREPHVKAGIIAYFNQLKTLMEKQGIWKK